MFSATLHKKININNHRAKMQDIRKHVSKFSKYLDRGNLSFQIVIIHVSEFVNFSMLIA